MDKVKLTQEQGKAMDALLDTWSCKGTVVPPNAFKRLFEEKALGLWTSPSFIAAKSISLEDFTKALLFGYETPFSADLPEHIVTKLKDEYEELKMEYRLAPCDDDLKEEGRLEGFDLVMRVIGVDINA